MGLLNTCTALLLISLGISQAFPSDFSYAFGESLEVDSSEHGQFAGPKSTSCRCGWTNKANGRIVGGKEAKVNEYPHMSGLAKKYGRKRISVFCGASIITPYHAITAAHCTYEEKDPLFLIVGEHDLNPELSSPHRREYEVEDHIEHYSFNKETYVNDVAILVMKEKIQFSDYIGPVCMPNSEMNKFLVGKPVRVTGWGTTTYMGTQSKTLLKVDLRVIALDQCGKLYKNVNPRLGYQFCTYNKKKDACQGDSGGPVTWLDEETNRYVLAGLVSYGKNCGTIIPGVNTDVYAFKSWIESTIKWNSPETVSTCSKVD